MKAQKRKSKALLNAVLNDAILTAVSVSDSAEASSQEKEKKEKSIQSAPMQDSTLVVQLSEHHDSLVQGRHYLWCG